MSSHDIAVITPANLQSMLEAYHAGDQTAVTTVQAIDEFMEQPQTCMKCGDKFSSNNPALVFVVVLDPEIKRHGRLLLQHAGDGCGVAALCDNCVRGHEADCFAMVGTCLDLASLTAKEQSTGANNEDH